MRSSTSSSDIYLRSRVIPCGAWSMSFALAVVFFILFVVSLEWSLAVRGFQPDIVDSAQRWAHERQRARDLGHRALVLVGASRAQLDLDLITLGADSGLKPVQLAIDGASFVPVLSDLAEDDGVVGKIVVEYQDNVLGNSRFEGHARIYIREAAREREQIVGLDFNSMESGLAGIRQKYFRSYADGAGPFTALTMRALASGATPQYLVTDVSRERSADYSRVPMPYTYLDRAASNAGITGVSLRSSSEIVESQLSARIHALPQASAPDFADNVASIAGMVRRIEARGGEVIFVAFPRSGLVWEADDRRYPRTAFWDRFLTMTGAKGLHFMDVPNLATFHCPDGSHLDVRDKVRFTHAVVRALASEGWLERAL